MLGLAKFPSIGEGTYCVTLGPYAFYWFLLRPQTEPGTAEAAEPPTLTVSGAAGWEGVFRGKARLGLEEALPAYLQLRRWFQGRFRSLKSATVRDAASVAREDGPARIALIQAEYAEGDPELYVAPLAFAADGAYHPEGGNKSAILARVRVRPRGEGETTVGALYDPSADRNFIAPLVETATKGGRLEGDAGDLRGEPAPAVEPAGDGAADGGLHVIEESNTTAVLDGRGMLLKLYRRVEEGVHPEVEVLRHFARTGLFPHAPALLGVLDYQPETGEPITVGLVRGYVPGEGDAWRLTLDALRRFFDQILTGNLPPPTVEAGPRSVVDLSEQEIPEQGRELLGSYLETARLMARRTAEMHVALATGAGDPAFEPESFTPMYQRSLYQSMRGQVRQALERLRQRLDALPEALHEPARRVLQGEEELLRQTRQVLDRKINAPRIRCHGDYHLGHLVSIGSDFLVVDFEGEADRPLNHRRRKRSPIRDLTSLHRSLREAAQVALTQGGDSAGGRADAGAVGAVLAALGVGGVPEGVPGGAGDGGAAAARPQGTADVIRLLRPGMECISAAPALDAPSEHVGAALLNVLQLLPTGERPA